MADDKFASLWLSLLGHAWTSDVVCSTPLMLQTLSGAACACCPAAYLHKEKAPRTPVIALPVLALVASLMLLALTGFTL